MGLVGPDTVWVTAQRCSTCGSLVHDRDLHSDTVDALPAPGPPGRRRNAGERGGCACRCAIASAAGARSAVPVWAQRQHVLSQWRIAVGQLFWQGRHAAPYRGRPAVQRRSSTARGPPAPRARADRAAHAGAGRPLAAEIGSGVSPPTAACNGLHVLLLDAPRRGERRGLI
jgi:transposase